MLTENLGYYMNLYNIWSSYQAESEGVVIAYTSVYGHTKAAVELLAQKLQEKGCPQVVVHDLARCDMAEAVEDAFRYSKLVLATTTYNADIFPFMKEFIHHLTERNFQNRTVGLVENGSWSPAAARVMREMLADCKKLTFTKTTVKILSALNEGSRTQIDTKAELDLVEAKCKELGVNVALSEVWAKGGEGGVKLAEEVIRLVEEPNDFTYSYELEMPHALRLKCF